MQTIKALVHVIKHERNNFTRQRRGKRDLKKALLGPRTGFPSFLMYVNLISSNKAMLGYNLPRTNLAY